MVAKCSDAPSLHREIGPAPITNPDCPVGVLPVIAVDERILPHTEAILADVARLARRGDRAARDRLYHALLPKLRRIARGIYVPRSTSSSVGLWDRDDLEQELFVVFADVIDAWPEDIPIVAWVLSRMKWRLKDAMLTLSPRQHRGADDDEALSAHLPDADTTSDAAVQELLDQLTPLEREVVLLLLVDGLTQQAAAARLGVSRRTLVRIVWRVRQKWSAWSRDAE